MGARAVNGNDVQRVRDEPCASSGPPSDASEYWIDVNAVADPVRDCYVATVVVRGLPDMREVFREEFPAGRLRQTPPRDVFAAALARGQRAVRLEQCRKVRP